MKAPHRCPLLRPLLLAGLALATLATRSAAQVVVTGATYGALQNTTNRTAGNITYLNEFRPVTSVATGAGDYQFNGPTATTVSARRNTGAGNPNNTTAFFQYSSTSGGTATVFGAGDTTPTLDELLRSGDLTQGIRNPFANGAGSTNSNIERLDFFFSGGYTVQAGDGLVFFDLENQNNFGDGFRIAAFTAVGTVNGQANAPTTYANTGLLVQPDSYGGPVNTPTGTNARYIRSTTTNGDNLASGQTIATIDTNQGTLGASDLYLVGILVRFSDLGITAGTTIFGYSLLADDVTPSTAANLVNWNDATIYPTNTNPATSGNIDFMAFGAQIARPVPEPSTYGMIFIGLGLAGFGLRRYLAPRRQSA